MATRGNCWVSIICGKQIYKTIWMLEIGENLGCEQERSNHEDPYTVSKMEDDTIVGHVPHKKSCI